MEIVISLTSSDAAELRALATFEELPLPDVVVSAVRARIVAARERAAVLDRLFDEAAAQDAELLDRLGR